MMLCINLGLGVLLVPLALAFRDNKSVYWITASVVLLVLGAPFIGWVFERFAAGSARLSDPRTEDDAPA